jgi:transcriptional regulator with XRE-family HTH domain
MTVGETLRMHRKNAGLTQRDLAKKCGIRADAISRIEKGSANPTMQTLFKIWDTLDLQMILINKISSQKNGG